MERSRALPKGNIIGLKASQLRFLERLERRAVPPDALISPELARSLAEFSAETGRQCGVLLDRRGRVAAVTVGDAHAVPLPDVPRRGYDRLCGLRLIHTHLRDEPLDEEDLTQLALCRLDLVAAVVVEAGGLPGAVHRAHLLPDNAGGTPWRVLPPESVHALPEDWQSFIGALEEEFDRTRSRALAAGVESRALLLHVSENSPTEVGDSVRELAELARSAGVDPVHTVIQRRAPDPKHVLGRGKLRAVLIQALQKGADLLVFDMNLTPSQVKALSDYTDLKILDRTQLILDIFARHAVTREGRLQVELAQMRYLMPLLNLRQTALSRLTGGIGGRGPGETRLEVDRRRARDRLARLEKEVSLLGGRRVLRRQVRVRRAVPTIAVVGYTNAGKSTLLNQLTGSEVVAKDFLFATLNPVSRRLRFPREREVIITDTVGFIRQLPATLMAAFRTTFEEIRDADLLLHVMDASCADLEARRDTVLSTLRDLELDAKPVINVLNKADLADPDTLSGLVARFDGVATCALDRNSFTLLLERMETALWRDTAGAAREHTHETTEE
ncbi:MAG TPA: GTPase HflX [Candidatus Hydrogenedentes bacterium]|nr:GTPase HflX [Candidatus Hydrogenedentota bacterium]